MAKAHVTIHLKPGISDPEGQTTLKTVHLLGFPDVSGVHTTRIWTLDFPGADAAKAKQQADQICRRLLTNPVLHDYSIRIEA